MAGLPPVPSDVAKLEQTVLVLGRAVTTAWWLRNPDWEAIDGPHAESFLASYFATVMPNLLGLMHTDSMCTTCRLSVGGFVAEGLAPDNHGEWVGATELAVASGLKWITRERGRRGWSMSYVPATPAQFVANHWQLSSTGYGTLRAQGLLLLQNLNLLVGPLGALCEVGTLQRKAAGAPLPSSLFVGYADVYPIEKLVTIGRRIPPSGVVLPL